MTEAIFALFTITGGIVWILTFAWAVGYVADKCGVGK